jgi:hypothetical protein
MRRRDERVTEVVVLPTTAVVGAGWQPVRRVPGTLIAHLEEVEDVVFNKPIAAAIIFLCGVGIWHLWHRRQMQGTGFRVFSLVKMRSERADAEQE